MEPFLPLSQTFSLSTPFSGKLFFSSLRVDVARIWQPDPREVRVRWTVVGHPRGPFSPSTVGVFDGVSTFRLDSKGFVYEHAVDNVILRPRGGVLKSPLFAGLGLAGLGSAGGGGQVAVPGGAGGGGGGGDGGGFPCPNFRGAAGEVGGSGAAPAGLASSDALLPTTPDPSGLAAARAALAAAWAASSGGGAGPSSSSSSSLSTTSSSSSSSSSAPSILIVRPPAGEGGLVVVA